jgi:protein ImuA
MTVAKKSDILSGLQSDILRLQGFKPINSSKVDLGLGPIRNAFANSTFPLGCIHEFLSSKIEDSAATKGFITAMLGALMGNSGISLWISSSRTIFPPALKHFGVDPDRFIFIELQKESDVLWAMDEALKCGALASVVAEIKDISFTMSRRFQLAVEQSQVTGFIVRNSIRKITTTACVSRWKITSLATEPIEDLPGIGFPKWRVELLRIRNGHTGVWDIQWKNGRFQTTDDSTYESSLEASSASVFHQKKAG